MMLSDGMETRRWAALYDEFGGSVFRYVWALCDIAGLSSDTAARVTCDVFVAVCRDPGAVDPHTPTRVTLLADARRRVADLTRLDGNGATVDADRSTGDKRTGLLRRLDPTERDVLTMITAGGCTLQQAAIALGETDTTIRTRITVGLRQLHQHGHVNRSDSAPLDE